MTVNMVPCACGEMNVPRGGYGLVRYDDDRPDRRHVKPPGVCDPPADWWQQLAELQTGVVGIKSPKFMEAEQAWMAENSKLELQIRTLTREHRQAREYLHARTDERDSLNAELQAQRASLIAVLQRLLDCAHGHHSWADGGRGPCLVCDTVTPARPAPSDPTRSVLRNPDHPQAAWPANPRTGEADRLPP